MNRKTVNRIFFINIIFASIVILDLLLPSRAGESRIIDSFYFTQVNTGTLNKPTIEDRRILSLSTGETYRIAVLPKKPYKKGQLVILYKSFIFSNLNKIDVGYPKEHLYVGMFSSSSISILFALAILTTILNYFFDYKVLNILLVASFMFIIITALIYIIYY